MTVVPYAYKYKEHWDAFVKESKNATFLFERDFMEYHSSKYDDSSVLVFDKKNKIVAVCAANVVGKVIYSHQGLTYGGIVVGKSVPYLLVEEIFVAVCRYYGEKGKDCFEIKLLPSFYSLRSSEEFSYILHKYRAERYRVDFTSALALHHSYGYSTDKKRNLKNQVAEIEESCDYRCFWDKVLLPNLAERHDVVPPHSADEILYLAQLFPENIKLYTVLDQDVILAGTVLFITDNTVHAQYIAASAEGKKSNALDHLFDFLIKRYSEKSYFNFGVSNEQQGKVINEGLLRWKEGFGARSFVHEFYRVDLTQFKHE